MFHIYFLGSAEGLLFDVPDDDYDTALWAPLGRYLHRLGVEVRTSAPVVGIASDEEGVRVEVAGGELPGDGMLTADAVVIAADPASARRLVADSALGSSEWRERVSAARNAPPFAVWRLWLDRPVDADVRPSSAPAASGRWTTSRCWNGSRRGARVWAQRTGGSVVEVHGYAVAAAGLETGADGRPRVQTELEAALHRVYPETAAAGVVAQEWLVMADCPLVDTSPWALRPGVRTPDPRVLLAGDHVRCDLPVALMERAATTGFPGCERPARARGVWPVRSCGPSRCTGSSPPHDAS